MKSMETIYQELLADFAGRTGYRPQDSCDLAARLYAVAAQVQTLLAQTEWVAQQAFPQTATGVYLDYHAQSRGIDRVDAAAATGSIRFYAPAAVLGEIAIPAGTVCMNASGVRFETVEDGVIAAGEREIEVAARAVEPGSAGNAAAHTVTLMAVIPAGVAGCDNPAPFTGGREGEDDESLRQRILESFRRLPNGANAAFYELEAMSVPGVAAAQAVGRARGIGTVDVYVAAQAGIPDEALLETIAAALQKKREIAVDVQVLPPEEIAVEVRAVITPAAGFSAQEAAAAAEQALRSHFTGALLGKGVKVAQLGDLLYHLEAVENYRMTAPAGDLAGAVGVLPVLADVVLTEEA